MLVSDYYVTGRRPASVSSEPKELLSIYLPARKESQPGSDNFFFSAQKILRKSTTSYNLHPQPSLEAIEFKN